jgi:hypothetical protein
MPADVCEDILPSVYLNGRRLIKHAGDRRKKERKKERSGQWHIINCSASRSTIETVRSKQMNLAVIFWKEIK